VKLRNDLGEDFLIEIDGGVNVDTIKLAHEVGVDVFVAGSAIFSADNISAAATELKNLIK